MNTLPIQHTLAADAAVRHLAQHLFVPPELGTAAPNEHRINITSLMSFMITETRRSSRF